VSPDGMVCVWAKQCNAILSGSPSFVRERLREATQCNPFHQLDAPPTLTMSAIRCVAVPRNPKRRVNRP
jgi:hypothetical protein